MKILLCTYHFNPDQGGLETVARLLATEFVAAGHEVRICTHTPGGGADDLDFTVHRNPTKAAFRQDVDWADIVLHNNISVPWAIPLILRHKPWVCGNHDWPRSDSGELDLRARLKLRLAQLASRQTAVSHALAAQLRGNPTIVGNPYDGADYRPIPGLPRDRDVVFLGRLFEGKGVHILLGAAELVRQHKPDLTVTIIGKGPEREALELAIKARDLAGNVMLAGALSNEEAAREMNRHRVFVLPSRVRESFGVVVLEAMACGCVAIGSDCGGVPEAIGDDGPIFPIGNEMRLAELLRELLTNDAAREKQLARQAVHLAKFNAASVAGRYLAIFEDVLQKRAR